MYKNTNNLRKVIGIKLKEARLQANLDQISAGRRIGKSGDFVSNSELGKRKLTLEDLIIFSKAYKTNLLETYNYLLIDYGNKS